MDLEFREPTAEEKSWVINKTKEASEKNCVVYHTHDGVISDKKPSKKANITICIVIMLIVIIDLVLRDLAGSNGQLFLIAQQIAMGFIIVIASKRVRKKSKETQKVYNGLSAEEVDNRVMNAKLYLADVSMIKRELISTGKDDACYIEVVDKNSVLGHTVEMHVSREIYDGFEEGKDAYVVWWDFPNSSIGADVCEIMFKSSI